MYLFIAIFGLFNFKKVIADLEMKKYVYLTELFIKW